MKRPLFKAFVGHARLPESLPPVFNRASCPEQNQTRRQRMTGIMLVWRPVPVAWAR
jgi:hypothetical protein